jgi:hypothetical protein
MDSRVVVRVKHLNKKKFNGYITPEYAMHQIFQAIGLELSNHQDSDLEDEKSSTFLSGNDI